MVDLQCNFSTFLGFLGFLKLPTVHIAGVERIYRLTSPPNRKSTYVRCYCRPSGQQQLHYAKDTESDIFLPQDVYEVRHCRIPVVAEMDSSQHVTTAVRKSRKHGVIHCSTSDLPTSDPSASVTRKTSLPCYFPTNDPLVVAKSYSKIHIIAEEVSENDESEDITSDKVGKASSHWTLPVSDPVKPKQRSHSVAVNVFHNDAQWSEFSLKVSNFRSLK